MKKSLIPLVIEELVPGDVGFSADSSSSLAACSRARPLAPDRESAEASLPVSQFFNPSRYILITLVASLPFSAQAQETGSASSDAAEQIKQSNWQNWVFAGTAVVTITVCMLVVSLNQGSSGTAH
jgi:hypothetical protein